MMTIEKNDSLQFISVRLNNKNYSFWSTVMKNFLKGKNCGDYVSETIVKSKSTANDFVPELDAWESNNEKFLLEFIILLSIQLEKYETSKEVWGYLQELYAKSNFAK